MKTILIATDYSRCANNALEYAAALAKGLHARLVVFYAFNLALVPPTTAADYVPDVDDLIWENNERLNTIGAKVSEAYGIEVIGVSTTDLVLDGLKKQVKKFDVDLLVLGLRGKSIFTRVLGTITTSVIKRSKCPVLLVPEDAAFRGIRKILFACNYRYLSSNSKLEAIYEIASTYQAQVQILHVEKDVDFIPSHFQKHINRNKTNMEELLRGIKHNYRFLHEDDIHEGIKRGTEELNADVLVMVPHKPVFLKSLIHPSVTKKMVLHTHIPLLALPNIKNSKAAKEEQQPEKASL
ncbi:UspA domain-containing protein [Flammeovirgaceae bacterium 311]|nr:UspA domain-containing protein [Flammeovirgaceae bacterium 311]